MLGSNTGSEVMRCIAAPLVGGMLSATVLTLLVILQPSWCGTGARVGSNRARLRILGGYTRLQGFADLDQIRIQHSASKYY